MTSFLFVLLLCATRLLPWTLHQVFGCCFGVLQDTGSLENLSGTFVTKLWHHWATPSCPRSQPGPPQGFLDAAQHVLQVMGKGRKMVLGLYSAPGASGGSVPWPMGHCCGQQRPGPHPSTLVLWEC